MIMIYGIGLDSEGRCLHYHTKCDVVALKCNKCKEYFVCYQCHNQLQNHPFKLVSKEDVAPVIRGSCRHFLTFAEYKKGACPYCHHAFNPKCQVHETIYFKELFMKNVRDLLYIAMMSTILVILGFIPAIPLGFIPVPIVLQNLGVMLAGILLGWKKGTLSILLFDLLGMFIPAFSGSTFFTIFAGPTLGYVIAWLFVPMVISGILAIFKKTSFVVNLIAILLGGMIFVDVVGAVYLSVYTHTPLVASLLSNLAFIPGDTIKSVVAAMIAYKFKDKLIPSQVAC